MYWKNMERLGSIGEKIITLPFADVSDAVADVKQELETVEDFSCPVRWQTAPVESKSKLKGLGQKHNAMLGGTVYRPVSYELFIFDVTSTVPLATDHILMQPQALSKTMVTYPV